jgi:hypothetical protein
MGVRNKPMGGMTLRRSQVKVRSGLTVVLGLLMAGCTGFGSGNGGGVPGGYGYPGQYGGYGYPNRYGGYGVPGGYGYYPPHPVYPQRQVAPPSPEQKQLEYLYQHRDQIQKLPPEQRQQVLRHVDKLLKQPPR